MKADAEGRSETLPLPGAGGASFWGGGALVMASVRSYFENLSTNGDQPAGADSDGCPRGDGCWNGSNGYANRNGCLSGGGCQEVRRRRDFRGRGAAQADADSFKND